jgi:hypothetical protein
MGSRPLGSIPSWLFAYQVQSTVTAPSTVEYRIACDAGEPAFDSFDLRVDPSEQASSFSLVSGPPGWAIAPSLVSRGGDRFLRVTGPSLGCPGSFCGRPACP